MMIERCRSLIRQLFLYLKVFIHPPCFLYIS